ncbi:S8 family serine peptidase, partial [uncultured Chitinophaga sp.]|uniref:S8 family serine peptidase n=1 Tax=uncultured Chitinophaga sp. TaxID=339340 RepID=UPI0025E0000A
NINDVIKAAGVDPATIKINAGKFFYLLEIALSLDALDVANRIQETKLAVFSYPNFIAPIELHQVIPNDTYFANQFYLRNTGQVFNPVENHAGTANADINASFAWTRTTGNNNIIVAVLDQGVTSNHPDLPNTRQVRLNGSNFVPGENANDPSPGASDNHGNACAGIIAATQNNNEGISGVAPSVRIMPIKIMSETAGADAAGLANAIDFAWQNGAHVISNSWGFNNQTNPNFSPAIVNAITRAVTQGRSNLGCIVAFSASNSAIHNFGIDGTVAFPSNVNINGVLTVGASNRNDGQANYSPTSSGAVNNQIIDIVAPSHHAYANQIFNETLEVWTIDIPGLTGYNPWNDPFMPAPPSVGDILPTTGTNNLSYTGRMGGTSASCPQVAAAAALVLSLNNTLTQQAVFNILTQTADQIGGVTYTNGVSDEFGWGRLNLCAALTRVPNQWSITGTTPFCGSTSLSVPNLPAGSTVTWTSPAPLTFSGGNPTTVSGVATNATVTATVSVPNRCGSVALQTNITGQGALDPNAIGIYTDTYFCPGQYTNVGATYNGNLVCPINQHGITEVQWSINPAPADVQYNTGQGSCFNVYNGGIRIRPHPGGAYIISMRVKNLCGWSDWSEGSVMSVTCFGSFFTLSPNPSSSNLEVKVDEKATGVTSTTSIQEIIILDKLGNQIKHIKNAQGSRRSVIDVSGLKAGYYLVKVFNGKEWQTKTAIIGK